jgi:hypothetical protein
LHNAGCRRARDAILRWQSLPKSLAQRMRSFHPEERNVMSDTIFLFTTLAFFTLASAYTRACAWL